MAAELAETLYGPRRARTTHYTRDPGWVYFVQAGEEGPIKIGSALHVARRLKGLQISHWQELVLLGKCWGGTGLESKLHHQFARTHIRGEWFADTPELRQAIREMCAA